jgi:HD-like signal output (HDOD) protein
MNRNQMQAKLQTIYNLPTLPVIAMEANRLLLDSNLPIEQLMNLLEKDPALVAKILRLVNSSFYGFRCKINNLQHAVTLLGYNTIRNAVVTVAVMDTLTLKKQLQGFEIDTFWRHAIEVAVISRYLAVNTRLVPAEDAFICGLLHDIGKVVLANFFPQELGRLLSRIQETGEAFAEVERSLSYWPHNHIGSYLAQIWLLPDALVQSIKHHHSGPTNAPAADLVTLVDVGNRLSHMMRGDTAYHLDLDLHLPAVGIVMSKALCGSRWYTEVKQEMETACDFFNRGKVNE